MAPSDQERGGAGRAGPRRHPSKPAMKRSNEMIGCALTFYPFLWRLGIWRSPGVWIGQIGPLGFVVSAQRPWTFDGLKID
jgi:hypothetical protein